MFRVIAHQHALRKLKKERREHSWLDQAILTTDHHYFETYLGIVAEGREESPDSSWVGVKVDLALYVSCIYPGHY